jgi:hypothetical protein
LNSQISPSEFLTRYIIQKAYYRADGTVRHNAFMPSRSGEVSVYRIAYLKEGEIWEIGKLNVAKALNKQLLGRADILTLIILNQKLKVESDPTPHPRHANIVGWPSDKEEQREIALMLAAEAQLHLI